MTFGMKTYNPKPGSIHLECIYVSDLQQQQQKQESALRPPPFFFLSFTTSLPSSLEPPCRKRNNSFLHKPDGTTFPSKPKLHYSHLLNLFKKSKHRARQGTGNHSQDETETQTFVWRPKHQPQTRLLQSTKEQPTSISHDGQNIDIRDTKTAKYLARLP